jgi:hypothetical protein
MPLEDFIIIIFCFLDDEVKRLYAKQPWRHRGFAPKMSDAEILTMEVIGSFMGFDADKHIWNYFKTHWLHFFPNLASRTTFVRQSANLLQVKSKIWQNLLRMMNASEDGLFMIDGFPMPVCNFRRAPILRTFKDVASYGYCRAKHFFYYGFHGNIIVNQRGLITNFTLTSANTDERTAMWDIVNNLHGFLIGDKGYISQLHAEDLKKERNIVLLTPDHKRHKKKKSQPFNSLILKFRKRVETVIGQLVERFNIERIRARDLWHLSSRLIRVFLAHTLAAFINYSKRGKIIQFADLIVS